MKTESLLHPAVFCLSLLTLQAADPTAAPRPGDMANTLGPGAYTVVERGPNHRIWSQVTAVTNHLGEVTYRTNSYTELASGMHHLVNGQWVESSEEIEITPTGARATNGSHKVVFSGELNTADAIDLTTPGGQHLKSHVLGLSYFDPATGKSVLIAELKDSHGQLLPTKNQVLYPDAFTDIKADVRYTYRRSGFEQDIILHEQPPPPSDWGLSGAARLQVLTEFFEAREPAIRSATGGPGALPDETLDFGSMKMGRGKAFSLGQERPSASVRKQWLKLEGRTFLVEEVPVDAISEQLQKLPAPSTSNPSPNPAPNSLPQNGKRSSKAGRSKFASNVSRRRIVDHLVLPSPKPAKKGGSPVQLASVPPIRDGLVMDYVTLNTETNAFTFQSDTTYYISGWLILDGTATFEGGTVLKFTEDGSSQVTCNSNVVCLTAAYHPAVFTSVNDNTIGELIAGSSGTPNSGGSQYLWLNEIGTNSPIQYMRFSYASLGFADYLPDVSNCQFINCYVGIDILSYDAARVALLHNVLFSKMSSFAVMQDGIWDYDIHGEHVTMDSGGYGFYDANAYLTNSIFVDTAYVAAEGSGDNNGFYNSPEFGSGAITNTSYPFQTVGAGSYYLADDSPFRNVGTTNIAPEVLAEIHQKTTYPPIVVPTAIITNDMALSPQAQRDFDTPDLGYHYDPIDYAFKMARFTNATLSLSPGTAISTASIPGQYGIALWSGAKFISSGTPTNLNHVVRYNLVQENSNTNWNGRGNSFVDNWFGGSAMPNLSATFTDWTMPARDGFQIFLEYSQDNVFLKDCQLHGGRFYDGEPNISLTNCLFDRVDTIISDDFAVISPKVVNCLFYHGNLYLGQLDSSTWLFLRNNLFDGTVISQDGDTDADYNAYLTNSTRLAPTNSHDIILSTTDYQTGPLGNYYYPTNGGNLSRLINAGSTSANLIGLYHYTVTTNLISGLQIKETNSVVDIGFHYVATDRSGNPIDTDGDGLADYFEDNNGDGIYNAGDPSDWTDYYNGTLPELNIISGNNQIGLPNSWLSYPLAVVATDTNSIPLANALITFSVTNGDALIATSAQEPTTNSINLRTDVNGQALVWLKLPRRPISTNLVAASAVSGLNQTQVTFTAVGTIPPTIALGKERAIQLLPTGEVISWGDNQYGELGDGTFLDSAIPVQVLGLTNIVAISSGQEHMLALDWDHNVWAWGRNQYGQLGDGTRQARNTAVPVLGMTNIVAIAAGYFHSLAATSEGAVWSWGEGDPGGGLSPVTVTNLTNAIVLSAGAHHSLAILSDGTVAAWGTNSSGQLGNNSQDPSILSAVAVNGISSIVGIAAGESHSLARDSSGFVWSWGNHTWGQGGWGDYGVSPGNLLYSVIPPWEPYLQFPYTKDSWLTTIHTTPATIPGLTNITGIAAGKNHSLAVESSGAVWAWGKNWYGQLGDGNLGVNDGFYGSFGSPIYSGAFTSGVAVAAVNDGSAAVDTDHRQFWWGWLGNSTNYPTPAPAYSNFFNGQLPVLTSLAGNGQSGYAGAEFPNLLRFRVTNTNGNPLSNAPVSVQVLSGSVFLRKIVGGMNYSGFRTTTDTNGEVSFVAYPYGTTETNCTVEVLAQSGERAAMLVFGETVIGTNTTSGFVVNILQPVDGQAFPVGPITLSATATNSGGTVSQVEFFDAQTESSLGIATTEPYTVVWPNTTAGNFQLKAVATDGLANTATSAVVTIYVVPGTEALRLWLKADAIMGLEQGTPLSIWSDSSGFGNAATQPDKVNRPIFYSNVVNSLPAVRFDGYNDFLDLPDIMTSFAEAEALVLLRATADQPPQPKRLWFMGGSGDLPLYPEPSGNVADDFAGNVLEGGLPSSPISQFHIYDRNSGSNGWTARINGTLQGAGADSHFAHNSSPTIGVSDESFGGDIAEVLLFNRRLTSEERLAWGSYLGSKYALATAPAKPSLTADPLSSSQMLLAWNHSSTDHVVKIQIERRQSTNSYSIVATLYDDQTATYADEGLSTNITYTYRARVWAYGGTSDYSDEVTATTLNNGVALPLSDLRLWLTPSALAHYTNGETIIDWPDASGNANDSRADTGTSLDYAPTINGGVLNGGAVAHFNGAQYLIMPDVLNGLNQAELFSVMRVSNANPPQSNPAWAFGGAPLNNAYPTPGGQIVEDFGSTDSHVLTESFQSLDQFHLYNVAGDQSRWSASINGISILTTSPNVFAGNAQGLGVNFGYQLGADKPFGFFSGDIAEIMIFDRVLTAAERLAVENYLNHHLAFAGSTNAPSDLAADPISSDQIVLSWRPAVTATNCAVSYSIERKTGSDPFVEIGTISGKPTIFFDSGLSSATEYSYRVKAVYFTFESDYALASATTFASGTSEMPTNGLNLWLKPEALTNSDGQPITFWADRSGFGNDGSQSSLDHQPVMAASAMNGFAAVRFDGTNDYIGFQTVGFQNFMSGFSAAEFFVVLKSSVATSDVPHTAWQLGGSGSESTRYPTADGQIFDDFGSLQNRAAFPVQSITAPHMYNACSGISGWTNRLNGLLLNYDLNNTFAVPFFSSPTLGTPGDSSQSFFGDIAEVLIYNRVLSSSERDSVSGYLNAKYGLVSTVPNGVTNIQAVTVSSNQVLISWTQPDSGSARYVISRKLIAVGDYESIATIEDTLSYIDGNLSPGTYSYKINAVNLAGTSVDSPECTNTVSNTDSSLPLSDLRLWLKSDAGVRTFNGLLDGWLDQSGSAANGSQPTPSSQPALITNGIGANSTIRFDGTHSYLNLPSFMSAMTQAEAFVVLKAVGSGSLWSLGNVNDFEITQYPDSSGVIIDNFASSYMHPVGKPVQSINEFHFYDVDGKDGERTTRINGTLLLAESQNSFGVTPYPTLGAMFTDGAAGYFNGDIAEVLIFDRILSGEERDSVGNYLNFRYNLVTTPPATPGQLIADAVSSSQIVLTWTPVLATKYLIERKVEGGSFAQIAIVRDATKYFDGGLQPTTHYYYRVKAINLAGSSSYAEADATTQASQTTVPLSQIKLWLKSDLGIWADGTNVALWPDISDWHNDAAQTTPENRPVFVANAFDGKPVIRFDGVNDSLNLPNLLQGASQAEMFVVLRSAADPPASPNGGIRFGPIGSTYPDTNGAILDDFGTASPMNSGTPLQALDHYHLYDVAANGNSWFNRLNGCLLLQTNSDGFVVNDSPVIGMSANPFAGDLAEVIVFNSILSSDQRSAVQSYFNTRYALVTNAPPAPVLSILTNGPTSITLSWNANITNAIGFFIERGIGTNGNFVVLAILPLGTETAFTDSNLTAGIAYSYRIRVASLAGYSDYSNVVIRAVDAIGLPDFINDLYNPLSGLTGNNTNINLRLYSPLPK